MEDAVAQVDEGVQHDFSVIDSGPMYVEYRRREIQAKLVSGLSFPGFRKGVLAGPRERRQGGSGLLDCRGQRLPQVTNRRPP